MPKFQDARWTVDTDAWVAREYELLATQYTHEDDAFYKTNALFTTLNGGLFVLTAALVSKQGPSVALCAPAAFGLLLCFAWLGALIRTRAWIKAIEDRIEELEHAVAKRWTAEPLLSPRLRMGIDERIRDRSDTSWVLIRTVSRFEASTMLLYVPVGAAALWIASAVYALVS